jgi:hypothetical protein
LKRNKVFFLICVMLIASLILSACQDINGIKINDALDNLIDAKNFKGKITISAQSSVDYSDQFFGDQAFKIINKFLSAFQNYTLVLSNMKTDKDYNMSANFLLENEKYSIQGKIFSKLNKTLIFADGMKKGLVLYNSDLIKMKDDLGIYTLAHYGMFNDKVTTKKTVSSALAKLLVHNLPASSNIKVTQTIDKNNQPLTQITGEFVQDKLFGLTMLQNMLNNEEELKKASAIIGDTIFAMQEESNNMLNPNNDLYTSYTSGEFNDYIFSKENASDDIYTFSKQFLKSNIDEVSKNMKKNDYTFNKNANFSMSLDRNHIIRDLYYKDESKTIIKNLEKPFEINGSASIHVENESDNSSVTTEPFDIELFDLNSFSTRKETYDIFDKSSPLYELLFKKLEVLKTNFQVKFDEIKDDEAFANYVKKNYTTPEYYKKNGITYIQLRNLSYKMHAQIHWDEKTRMITLDDSENIVTLSPDSDQVTINNKVIRIPNKPLVINNTTYLPIRVIVEALGGTVVWNEKALMFTVTLK